MNEYMNRDKFLVLGIVKLAIEEAMSRDMWSFKLTDTKLIDDILVNMKYEELDLMDTVYDIIFTDDIVAKLIKATEDEKDYWVCLLTEKIGG